MQYKQMGNQGVRVSPICLGTMMFGGQTDEALSIEIMHKAIDQGINFFDTADMYNGGESEVLVGKALADRRDRVVLATKGRQKMGEGPNDYGAGAIHMMRAVEASLRRLKTDYIDIYYDHAPDYTTPIEETLRVMDDMVRSGKVRYVGCSNYSGWHIMKSQMAAQQAGGVKFVTHQIHYTLEAREAEYELLPLAVDQNVGVQVWSPLAAGLLTGKHRRGGTAPKDSRQAAGWNEPPIRDMERLWKIVDCLVEIASVAHLG